MARAVGVVLAFIVEDKCGVALLIFRDSANNVVV